MMYGGDPYSFTAYPQVDAGRRVGRDPKIESLPTSASDAQYDAAFIDSTCMACGRNKGDADIKLDRIKRRREIKREKRKERDIKRRLPIAESVYADLYSVDRGELKRAMPDPELQSVVDQLDRERRNPNRLRMPSRARAIEESSGPDAVFRRKGSRSDPRVKVDQKISEATKTLNRIEGRLQQADTDDKRYKLQQRRNRAEARLRSLQDQRAKQEEGASEYLNEYVRDNRNRLVARYWPRLSDEEKRDAARELLEARQDPYVTQVLLAYAADEMNANARRRARRIAAPPADLGMTRSRSL